ncbi:hypothetical protein E2562_012960 [Oryza meyeriana var. granulata]|uniref:Uncharacterized protein n=1 Tax=Oryza meyeriana var. granulata TaxID=110450 RepID=A0A6G1DIJ0_9ORYZ|nr:hypothetical protein E2562_012960 [Oryza meyeriana var. granulata]
MAKLAVLVASLAVVLAATAVSTAHSAGGRRALEEYRSAMRVIIPSTVAGAPSSGVLDAAALGRDLPAFGGPAAGPEAASCSDEADCDNKVPVFGP